MNRTVIVIIFGVFLGISFLYDSHAASDEFDADKVRQLIEEEKFEEALDITTEFLSNNPDHEIALSLIAEIYWELDEYFAAQTNADKTLNINPKNENALYIKSKSLYRLDKFEDALSYIDQAIKVNNQNPSTLSRKGLILFQLEQYEEAISFYDKALSLEPENETTWERMGEALLELQMYEEAVTYFTKVLEVDPHDRDTLYNISMAIQYVEEKPLSSFFTYENNEAGLKLKYPPHWVQITEIPEPLLKFQIIYPDNTGTFLFGYSYTYLVDYTTENLFEDFIDGFGVDFEDFNVENSELITIDGNEGLKFEFTTKQSGNILKVMQIVILKNEATYLFTYSAPIEDYPNHLSTIQKIIDSITIVQLEIPIILYEDTLQNYKIEHPANWQKLEEEKREFGESYMVAFVSPFKNLNDTFPEEVNVVVTKGMEGYTMESLLDDIMRHYPRAPELKNFKLVDSTPTSHKGFPAHEIIYTAKIVYPYMDSSGVPLLGNNSFLNLVNKAFSEEVDAKIMQTIFLKDNVMYIITYRSSPDDFDSFLPEAQKVMDSFYLEGMTMQTKANIPDWIRNNAKWWAEGGIGDQDFVGGIQFLIKEKIITIPETSGKPAGEESQEIPAWVKNNADWWANGLITDDDFLKGIEYMVNNGIIVVS